MPDREMRPGRWRRALEAFARWDFIFEVVFIIVMFALLAAVTWTERERSLVHAYERVANVHNKLGITDPIMPTAQPFFGRPFATIATRGFAAAIGARIVDPAVRTLLDRTWIGAIDQVTDSTDVVETTTFLTAMRRLYV